MKRPVVAAVLLLALSGCAATGTVANDHSHSAAADVRPVTGDSPFKGAWLDEPYQLPSAELTDTSGLPVSWPADGLAKPVTVLFFGYTHCADGFCQTQAANAAAAIRGLPAEVRSQVQFVMVTTDPARDTESVLRAWLDQYSPEFVGMTGDFQVIEAAAAKLGVQIDPPPSPAPKHGYEVAHGTQLIGFGPNGTAPVVWLPETPVADLRADLVTLASGDW